MEKEGMKKIQLFEGLTDNERQLYGNDKLYVGKEKVNQLTWLTLFAQLIKEFNKQCKQSKPGKLSKLSRYGTHYRFSINRFKGFNCCGYPVYPSHTTYMDREEDCRSYPAANGSDESWVAWASSTDC